MKEENGISNIQKGGGRKWSKMIHQYISCALKWGEKDVSKNGSVLPVPCTWTVKTSTERMTSSSRAGFLVHAKKNIKSLPVSHSSTVFPLHLKATIEGKETFSISASDTSETWAWVHCSVEQGISCHKWRPKSILQAELLTTHKA